MQIDVKQENGIHYAALVGVPDVEDREAFERQLHPLISEPRNQVILDLSGIPRITSSGLGLLVTLVSRANTKGASIVLAAATPFVDSVIRVTRLDRFFVLAPTVEEAVHRLRNE